MIPGKYVKDYTLRETLGADGRSHMEPVYIGPVFRLKSGGEALRRSRLRLLLWSAVCGAGVLAPLLVLTPAVRRWYVMGPLALAILPAAMLARCTVFLLRNERFTRRERDTSVSALAPWSIALLALAALSLTGQVVFAAKNLYVPGDISVTLSAAALAAAGVRIFTLRGAFAAEEAPREPAAEQ